LPGRPSKSVDFPTSSVPIAAAQSITASRAGKKTRPARPKKLFEFCRKHLQPRGYKLQFSDYRLPEWHARRCPHRAELGWLEHDLFGNRNPLFRIML